MEARSDLPVYIILWVFPIHPVLFKGFKLINDLSSWEYIVTHTNFSVTESITNVDSYFCNYPQDPTDDKSALILICLPLGNINQCLIRQSHNPALPVVQSSSLEENNPLETENA